MGLDRRAGKRGVGPPVGIGADLPDHALPGLVGDQQQIDVGPGLPVLADPVEGPFAKTNERSGGGGKKNGPDYGCSKVSRL